MRERPHFTLGVVLPDAEDVLSETNQGIVTYHDNHGIYFHKIVRVYNQTGSHQMSLRGTASEVYSDDEVIPENAIVEHQYEEGEYVGSQSGYSGYHTHGSFDGLIYKVPVIYKKD